MIGWLTAILVRLRANRRGNVLMILGFALIPLTFSVGMGIDYARAARTQTKLNAITDAAVLAAVTQPMLSQTRAQAATAAINMWYGQVGITQCSGATVNRVSYNSCTVTDSSFCPARPGYGSSTTTTVWAGNDGTLCITVTDDSSSGALKRTIMLKYAASSGNIFANLLGVNSIQIGGTSTSTASPITYIDYYILLDISQSMGIGATQADMSALYTRTKAAGNEGCVFGCHVAQSGDAAVNDQLAHNVSPKITLRIDAAIAAIQNIIADAQSASGTVKNIRIGIYTMSDDPVTGQKLTVVSPPSSDYASLTTKAAAITLGNNVTGGLGDTNYVPQMLAFNLLLPLNGTGTTAFSPKNYVFLVSDGISDINVPNSCFYGHCNAAFDPTNCVALKLKATVGTIYTTYLPIYKNNDSTQGYDVRYTPLVLPYASQIAPNMQSCASDSTLYYEASDGPGINTAMRSLFASTVKAAHLTQ